MKAPRVEGASVHDEPRQVGHDTTQGLGVLIAELPPRRHSQPVRTSLNRRPAVAPSRRQGQLVPSASKPRQRRLSTHRPTARRSSPASSAPTAGVKPRPVAMKVMCASMPLSSAPVRAAMCLSPRYSRSRLCPARVAGAVRQATVVQYRTANSGRPLTLSPPVARLMRTDACLISGDPMRSPSRRCRAVSTTRHRGRDDLIDTGQHPCPRDELGDQVGAEARLWHEVKQVLLRGFHS
jgi:hypothetical protein